MKVCQVLGGNEEGGLEKHVVELANALSDRIEIYVIAHPKYAKRFNEQVVFFPLDLSKSRRNPWVLYRLYRIIRHIKPHIVHAHANKAVDMIAAIKALLPDGTKTIGTLHSQKNKLTGFAKMDCVVGVSHRIVESIRKVPVEVVYNGIHPLNLRGCIGKKYLERELGIPSESFLVVGVGRLEPVKNFALLIKAIAPLKVHLLLIGDGSQKKVLEDLVKQLDIENKVTLAGFRHDAVDLLSCADLCVISSEKEGFSYVAIEALMLGVPVVSTDVSDMRRILPREFVVQKNDTEALRDMIAKCQKDKAWCRSEFEALFSEAKEIFSFENMVQRILEIYQKVEHETCGGH